MRAQDQRPPPLPVLLFCVAFFGAGVFALANGLDNSVRRMAAFNAVNAAEYTPIACTKAAAEVVPSCCRNGVIGSCRICEEGSRDCGCSYVARVKVCASSREVKLMGAVGNPWSSALAAGCSWACHATYWHDCRESEDEARARVSSYTGSTKADCFVSAAGYVRLQQPNAQQGLSGVSPVSGVIFLSVFLCVCGLCLVNALRLLGDSLLDCMHRIQRGKQRAPASSPSANTSDPIEARSAIFLIVGGSEQVQLQQQQQQMQQMQQQQHLSDNQRPAQAAPKDPIRAGLHGADPPAAAAALAGAGVRANVDEPRPRSRWLPPAATTSVSTETSR